MKKLSYIAVFFLLPKVLMGAVVLQEGYGAWSIGRDLYDYIRAHVPEGEVIVELGSGYSTKALSEHYEVFSVEHDQDFLNTNRSFMNSKKHPVHFILAPIVHLDQHHWYDPTVLETYLPERSALVLIDGPHGRIGRYGFYDFLHLFTNTDYLVFDDVQRSKELKLLQDVAKKLGREYTIIGKNKSFGVIILKEGDTFAPSY